MILVTITISVIFRKVIGIVIATICIANNTHCKNKNSTYSTSSNSHSNNNHGRPDRERAPIHRCAALHDRFPCKAQYFSKYAAIGVPEAHVNKSRILSVPLPKYCGLQVVLTGKNLRNDGFRMKSCRFGSFFEIRSLGF